MIWFVQGRLCILAIPFNLCNLPNAIELYDRLLLLGIHIEIPRQRWSTGCKRSHVKIERCCGMYLGGKCYFLVVLELSRDRLGLRRQFLANVIDSAGGGDVGFAIEVRL